MAGPRHVPRAATTQCEILLFLVGLEPDWTLMLDRHLRGMLAEHWKCAMQSLPKIRATLTALALSLTGCAASGVPQSGPHLSPTECRDLASLRRNAPPTRAQHDSELSALRKAGYNPSPWNDPYYPEDLEAAQRLVNDWFDTECQQFQTE